jgi:FixJ family two-component response regulator
MSPDFFSSSAAETPWVIVVDDDEAMRDSLKFLFESYGLNVEEHDSVESYERDHKPHARGCLILDHNLPGMSGLSFLASKGDKLDLPVVMMSGCDKRDMRDRAMELNVLAYFEKPAANDLLVETIRRAVGNA